MVLACGSELIDDIRKAPNNVLTRRDALNGVRSVQKGELILTRVT